MNSKMSVAASSPVISFLANTDLTSLLDATRMKSSSLVKLDFDSKTMSFLSESTSIRVKPEQVLRPEKYHWFKYVSHDKKAFRVDKKLSSVDGLYGFTLYDGVIFGVSKQGTFRQQRGSSVKRPARLVKYADLNLQHLRYRIPEQVLNPLLQFFDNDPTRVESRDESKVKTLPVSYANQVEVLPAGTYPPLEFLVGSPKEISSRRLPKRAETVATQKITKLEQLEWRVYTGNEPLVRKLPAGGGATFVVEKGDVFGVRVNGKEGLKDLPGRPLYATVWHDDNKRNVYKNEYDKLMENSELHDEQYAGDIDTIVSEIETIKQAEKEQVWDKESNIADPARYINTYEPHQEVDEEEGFDKSSIESKLEPAPSVDEDDEKTFVFYDNIVEPYDFHNYVYSGRANLEIYPTEYLYPEDAKGSYVFYNGLKGGKVVPGVYATSYRVALLPTNERVESKNYALVEVKRKAVEVSDEQGIDSRFTVRKAYYDMLIDPANATPSVPFTKAVRQITSREVEITAHEDNDFDFIADDIVEENEKDPNDPFVRPPVSSEKLTIYKDTIVEISSVWSYNDRYRISLFEIDRNGNKVPRRTDVFKRRQSSFLVKAIDKANIDLNSEPYYAELKVPEVEKPEKPKPILALPEPEPEFSIFKTPKVTNYDRPLDLIDLLDSRVRDDSIIEEEENEAFLQRFEELDVSKFVEFPVEELKESDAEKNKAGFYDNLRFNSPPPKPVEKSIDHTTQPPIPTMLIEEAVKQIDGDKKLEENAEGAEKINKEKYELHKKHMNEYGIDLNEYNEFPEIKALAQTAQTDYEETLRLGGNPKYLGLKFLADRGRPVPLTRVQLEKALNNREFTKYNEIRDPITGKKLGVTADVTQYGEKAIQARWQAWKDLAHRAYLARTKMEYDRMVTLPRDGAKNNIVVLPILVDTEKFGQKRQIWARIVEDGTQKEGLNSENLSFLGIDGLLQNGLKNMTLNPLGFYNMANSNDKLVSQIAHVIESEDGPFAQEVLSPEMTWLSLCNGKTLDYKDLREEMFYSSYYSGNRITRTVPPKNKDSEWTVAPEDTKRVLSNVHILDSGYGQKDLVSVGTVIKFMKGLDTDDFYVKALLSQNSRYTKDQLEFMRTIFIDTNKDGEHFPKINTDDYYVLLEFLDESKPEEGVYKGHYYLANMEYVEREVQAHGGIDKFISRSNAKEIVRLPVQAVKQKIERKGQKQVSVDTSGVKLEYADADFDNVTVSQYVMGLTLDAFDWYMYGSPQDFVLNKPCQDTEREVPGLTAEKIEPLTAFAAHKIESSVMKEMTSGRYAYVVIPYDTEHKWFVDQTNFDKLMKASAPCRVISAALYREKIGEHRDEDKYPLFVHTYKDESTKTEQTIELFSGDFFGYMESKNSLITEQSVYSLPKNEITKEKIKDLFTMSHTTIDTEEIEGKNTTPSYTDSTQSELDKYDDESFDEADDYDFDEFRKLEWNKEDANNEALLRQEFEAYKDMRRSEKFDSNSAATYTEEIIAPLYIDEFVDTGSSNKLTALANKELERIEKSITDGKQRDKALEAFGASHNKTFLNRAVFDLVNN